MPAQEKRKHKPPKLFWRIIISAVGAALIFIAVSNFTLYFFGETASVSVTTRRIGGANDQYKPNKRYEWSVDYTFTDKNGVRHSGHTTLRGGDLPPKKDNRAYYFFRLLPVAPESETPSSARDYTPLRRDHPLWILTLFVFIITINSGLMYQVINPAFDHLTSLVSWYWAVPYILALIILRSIPLRRCARNGHNLCRTARR